MRLLLLSALLLAAPALAQRPFAAEDRAEFAARRGRLLERIGGGVAVVLAAPAHREAVEFRQSPDFWYLTGIEEPGAVLVLDGRAKEARVYARRRAPMEVMVEGAGLRERADAAATYGVKVLPLEQLLDSLPPLFAGADTLWLPLRPHDELQHGRDEVRFEEAKARAHPLLGGAPPAQQRAVERLRALAPSRPAADVTLLLDRLRWVKTPYEVARLREAGRVGAEAVARAIQGTRPGQGEYALAADANWVVQTRGARIAFRPIVASGPNAVTWHYTANARRMRAGDLVLMDYGADVDGYTSDITRTWPVSGAYTAEQEKMYRCVLEARDAIIAAMKPGATIAQLQDAAAAVYAKHGYAQAFEALGRYVGHPVGISVHDVTPERGPSTTLVAGVVWNVEPILELRDRGIHIRLEDTVLVTATGAENLTAGVPSAPRAVEALARKGGTVP